LVYEKKNVKIIIFATTYPRNKLWIVK